MAANFVRSAYITKAKPFAIHSQLSKALGHYSKLRICQVIFLKKLRLYVMSNMTLVASQCNKMIFSQKIKPKCV